MKHDKSNKHYAALVGGLTIISVLGANVILSSVALPGSLPLATVSAKGTGGGSQIFLPNDFPADFNLPTGKLIGTAGTSPTWSVGLNIDGFYSTVMPALRGFYVANGFTDLNPDQTIPFGFENNSYAIQIVGRDRDHTGPMSTDVTIVIHKK